MFLATDTGYLNVRDSRISNLKTKGCNCSFGNVGLECVGWDSAVRVGNRYGMDGSGFEPQWKPYFYTSPDWPWGSSSLLYKRYRAPSPEAKWPRRGVYQPSRSDAEVEESAELYF